MSLLRLLPHQQPVTCVAFLHRPLGMPPGGPVLLATGAEDGGVRIWDAAAGNFVRKVAARHLSEVVAMR